MKTIAAPLEQDHASVQSGHPFHPPRTGRPWFCWKSSSFNGFVRGLSGLAAPTPVGFLISIEIRLRLTKSKGHASDCGEAPAFVIKDISLMTRRENFRGRDVSASAANTRANNRQESGPLRRSRVGVRQPADGAKQASRKSTLRKTHHPDRDFRRRARMRHDRRTK